MPEGGRLIFLIFIGVSLEILMIYLHKKKMKEVRSTTLSYSRFWTSCFRCWACWHSYAFTWFKSLGIDRVVEEKKDRAMANDIWFDNFQNAKLEYLTTTSSDHYPLWLDCAHYKKCCILPGAEALTKCKKPWQLDVCQEFWQEQNHQQICSSQMNMSGL